LIPEDDGACLGPALRRVQVVRGRMSDWESWSGAVAHFRPTECIHLAWNTTPGVYLDTAENLDWLSWSARLFSHLPEWGCRRILGVGTCAEYDTDFGYLRESTPLRPATLYAACKASLRFIGQQIAAQKKISFTWARLFYLYGPREHPQRLVSSCIRALAAGQPFEASAGTQVRDFLHTDDVAGALLALVSGGHDGDFNICSGRPVEVRTILSTIARILGRDDLLRLGVRPSRPWDPPFICGDATRLQSTGWRPRLSLEDGLASTVDWWRGAR